MPLTQRSSYALGLVAVVDMQPVDGATYIAALAFLESCHFCGLEKVMVFLVPSRVEGAFWLGPVLDVL